MNRALLGLALAAMPAAAAWADSDLVPPPALNEKCVSLTAGSAPAPAYPRELNEAKRGGNFRVELEFRDAGSSPRMKVLEDDPVGPHPWLVDAVQDFVRGYRNTCMRPGDAPRKLRQEFDFVPNEGRKVSWTIPAVASGAAAGLARECIAHVGPDRRPYYPTGAARRDVSVRVVASFEFRELNAPPIVTLVTPVRREDVAESVRRFAEGYRLKCGSVPVLATQSYNFRMEGAPVYALADTTLRTFLTMTRNVLDRPVFFDLDRMGCPFDVRLGYWQPFRRNRVGEVGAPRVERRAFLDWLAGLQLQLSDERAADVAGDELTIAVPCGKVDLS